MTGETRLSLAPEAAAAGFRLLALAVTGSTNDEALLRAKSGERGPLWVVAGEQTGGRGRHGRSWASPPGNLHASLLLTEPCAERIAPQLGFVAGLALHDALAAVTGFAAPRLALKWPNDLLLDGAKLAGVLLEAHRTGPAGAFAVVIGIGVNLLSAPTDTPYPATSLAALAGQVAVGTVLAALSKAVVARLAEWQRGEGFSAVRQAWLTRAAGLGAAVTVRLPGDEARGLFAGMDAAGRLLLDGAAGRRVIDAGDLFFPSAFRSGERGR